MIFENIARKFYYPGAVATGSEVDSDPELISLESLGIPSSRYYTSEEKDLAYIILYAKAADGEKNGSLYYDKDLTKKVYSNDLLKLFCGSRIFIYDLDFQSPAIVLATEVAFESKWILRTAGTTYSTATEESSETEPDPPAPGTPIDDSMHT